MPSKDAIQRVSCEGKTGYDERYQALQSIERLRRHKNIKGYSAYKCQFCKRWHIGSYDRDLIRSALGYTNKRHLRKRFKSLLKQREH